MPTPYRKPKPKRLFDLPDISQTIKACLNSGVELTDLERLFLKGFRLYRPSAKQWETLQKLCDKCEVK